MTGQNAEATVALLEVFFQLQKAAKNQIVDLAAKHRLPTIAMYSDYAKAGGLMSFGSNRFDVGSRNAVNVASPFRNRY